MATVEELQTIVQTVDAKLEEFNHRLRDLSRRIDALQVGISKRRVLQATPPPAPAAEPPGPSEPEAAEGPEPAEVEEAKSARLAEGEKAETLRPPIPSEEVPAEVSPPKQIVPPPAPAGPITREMVDVAVLNPGEVFRAAHEDYVKGNYDLAILGFRDYLKKYPATEQASSAQYWLGESYLSQSDYSKAVEEFQRLLDMYPTSPKVPTALYKQSLAYRELKQHDKARTNLDAVVSQFPTSVEAKHAAEELKTLPASQ
jgi:tol-pal system protein YbgF